ncbi:hypothetical protein AMK68_01130 [candidate division KD3-62 bacterium DG_56]|uniref:Uncharacterized protein n=1 Tax=candidate division KD3-62 bacterium DG_56 TaxID=1704032 RepID=A0A0S7XQ28_9BACT|nr:MAG: hypothetical protein AMK68_01130 [candidate division KD3-62 bacterium DG_56]
MRYTMLTVAALVGVCALPAGAQPDVLSAARAADAKVYFPQEHGLRDLRADIQIEAKAETAEVTRLRYLWKSPGCERWMSLGEHPAVIDSPDFFDVWAVAIVRRPLVEALASCRQASVRRVGNDLVITGVRGPTNLPERIEITVSKGLPSRLERKWHDRAIIITDIRYEKRGGGQVPSRFRLEVQEAREKARIDVSVKHQEIHGIWLPESITIKSGRESARLVVGRCQVNEGVPELKCEPPPPAGAAPTP